ncbi:elongation factor G, III-V domain-containing protein [Tanacetum coccineum]
MIYAHPNIKPTYNQDSIKAHLELEVTRSQCKRAKAIVIKGLEKDVLHEYIKLNDYARALVDTNPRSSVDIEIEKIGLDGCFLKGVVKGMLLTAVGKDRNNQMFPVAWAIVQIEPESSWIMFLKRLIYLLLIQHVYKMGQKYDKGLLNAVAVIFPKVEHRLCARHIYANWYSDFHGEQLKMSFYAIVKCANEAQLQKRLVEIENIHDGAKKSLEKKDIKQWCRAYFKGYSKCDSVDNNSTKAWNFVFIHARSKPIISMNEDLGEYIMKEGLILPKNGDFIMDQTLEM